MQKQLQGNKSFDPVQNGVFVLLGLPNSGKSTVTSEILLNKNDFIAGFDMYLVFSPSVLPGIEQNENFYSRNLNAAWLGDRLDTISQLVQDQKNSIRLLIVFDDCVVQLKKQQDKAILSNLFYNRRHIIPNVEISILVVTQQYTRLPTIVRSTATHYIIFASSRRDLDDFRKENTSLKNREWDDICRENLDREHRKIYIQINPFRMYQDTMQRILIESDSSVFAKQLVSQIRKVVNEKQERRIRSPQQKEDRIIERGKYIDLNELFNIQKKI